MIEGMHYFAASNILDDCLLGFVVVCVKEKGKLVITNIFHHLLLLLLQECKRMYNYVSTDRPAGSVANFFVRLK